MVRSSLWTKTVALGMLIGASVIGNAAVSAAHSREDARADATLGAIPSPLSSRASESSDQATVGTIDPTFAHWDSYGGLGDGGSMPSAAAGDDADGGSSADAQRGDDVGQVVPALYAWDPDVRFVFYRHISKWM